MEPRVNIMLKKPNYSISWSAIAFCSCTELRNLENLHFYNFWHKFEYFGTIN